ncbi:MAG: hypothetical protein ACJ762_09105 [Solirubrobacteraceae bacterium]
MEELDYDDAMAVLVGWVGRQVLVVAFVEPGVSLRPFAGTLSIEEEGHVVRAAITAPGSAQPVRIAFPSATFHDAEWVPNQEERGLSIEQGATRVDVFLDD